ncbi:MAG TPA: hypothetical protein VFQ85_18185 [Mycobacteriales bacterium]|jgi:hypothetical protein|nr:hypothetical protein [Mycobacteriales bacterium]
MDADRIVVDNGKRTMTLNELARSQPGMDRLMAEIAERARRLYFAATAGNWPAAGYFCRTLGKHLRESAFSRPKYAAAMEEFLTVDYAPVRDAIAARDESAFASAWDHLVDRVNHWHEEFGKGYLVYRTPDTPPPDLDLTPRP